MKTTLQRLMLLLAAAALTACSAPQDPDPVDAPPPPPEDEPEEVDDGMAIEGLTGTLRRDEVDPVLNDASVRFQQCYVDAYEDHPYLAGDLAMELVVSPDGRVSEVRTTTATLGSHEVEACMLDIARGLRFPRPHGGEATFDYGPLVMGSDDGHPFEVWDIGRLEEEQWEAVQAAIRTCTDGVSGYRTTLYVGPGGQVRSIGAVAPDGGDPDGARCLEDEIVDLSFPDPGTGQIAKMTVEL